MRFNWKRRAGTNKIGKNYRIWWYFSWRVWSLGVLYRERPTFPGREKLWEFTIGLIFIKVVLIKYKNEDIER